MRNASLIVAACLISVGAFLLLPAVGFVAAGVLLGAFVLLSE